jgi:hypothetical protein
MGYRLCASYDWSEKCSNPYQLETKSTVNSFDIASSSFNSAAFTVWLKLFQHVYKQNRKCIGRFLTQGYRRISIISRWNLKAPYHHIVPLNGLNLWLIYKTYRHSFDSLNSLRGIDINGIIKKHKTEHHKFNMKCA